ncbi:MAG: orotidine 5'-phosphate decarboxylase [Chromatiaceae bacterium]|nr:orotidine 5'-phosphate decarboxylase [Gammaproteobacteria bacterium]MCP5407929.1 orotidine 5'-phosphate decarboxylase [Chromatiaceae bacterium]
MENETAAMAVIGQVADEVSGIKLGNSLLYRTGPGIIARIKTEFVLPVIADLKITDVSHVAAQVAQLFAKGGADAVTVSGICGPVVIADVCKAVNPSCEVWLFTEFTDQFGLLDEENSESATLAGLSAGAVGFQSPGNRPGRVEAMRQLVGPDCVIMSCGMGTQGGEVGTAVSSGANFEIIGRSIYAASDPQDAARRFCEAINRGLN